MVTCEILLLATLAAMLISASYSDLLSGIVSNKLLVRCMWVSIPIDVLYYGLWTRDLLLLFILNAGLITFISLMLYAYHIWAAGDSKLLIAAMLCIPGRFLIPLDVGPFPTFWILVVTFVSAFLFLIVEALVRGVRAEYTGRLSIHIDVMNYVYQWLAMMAAIMIMSGVFARFIPQYYISYPTLTLAINFCLILSLAEVRNHASEQAIAIAAGVLWAVLIILSFARICSISFGVSIRSVVLTSLVICAQLFTGRYNYQLIPTEEVAEGQILAVQTIMGFQTSRVKGLPQGITEDMRSRLTESEAASVRRWGASAHGKPTVVIVRKIPFAVFISLGTLAFVVAEGVLLWH